VDARECARLRDTYIPPPCIVRSTRGSQCPCESRESCILAGTWLMLWLGLNRVGNGASGWHKTRPSSVREREQVPCRQLMLQTCPSLLMWRRRVEKRKHVGAPLCVGRTGASCLALVGRDRIGVCNCGMIRHWDWRCAHPRRLSQSMIPKTACHLLYSQYVWLVYINTLPVCSNIIIYVSTLLTCYISLEY